MYIDPDLIEKSIDILRWMVGYDTTSNGAVYKTNLRMIGRMEEYFRGLGIKTYPTKNTNGTSVNLLAHLGGPEEFEGVVLSGHTDVVDIGRLEKWSSDPFVLRQTDGKLYGRGTTDMKAFLAMTLAMAPIYKTGNLKTPIWGLYSCDEEIPCKGVETALIDLKQKGFKAHACWIGEPTDGIPTFGHFGRSLTRLNVTATQTHTAKINLPDRGNAMEAAMIIGTSMQIGSRTFCGIDHLGHSQFGRATFTPVECGKGVSLNTSTSSYYFIFDSRMRPGTTEQGYLAKIMPYFLEGKALAEVGKDPGVITAELIIDVPSAGFYCPNPNTLRFFQEVMQNFDSRVIEFNTEAPCMKDWHEVTHICGPGYSELAHALDENISIKKMEDCLEGLIRLGNRARVHSSLRPQAYHA